MVEYVCTKCGGLQYSAATQDHKDTCIYCKDGKVVRAEKEDKKDEKTSPAV